MGQQEQVVLQVQVVQGVLVEHQQSGLQVQAVQEHLEHQEQEQAVQEVQEELQVQAAKEQMVQVVHLQ
jgi:methionine salvage enolase-phosphatase E1